MPVQASVAAPAAQPCVADQPGGPVWVDASCVDPDYDQPVIDHESDVTDPIALHKVQGHFKGTSIRFTIYLPPAAQWQGRFYQYVYPTQSENALPVDVAFGAAHGGYTVQATGAPGYRHEAATAKFSRQVAAAYYGVSAKNIFGYVYGGSGGSYVTVGAIENTSGVWQGAVPFVAAIPTTIPNSWSAAALGGFVLGDKLAKVADAVAPGGSGDPYTVLDSTQRAVLHEVTSLGMPLRSWERYNYVIATSTLRALSSIIKAFDPTYVDDFWNKPGYLGAEASDLGRRFRAARATGTATVEGVARDASGKVSSLTLSGVPAGARTLGMDFSVTAADGSALGPLTGSLDAATGVLAPAADASADVLSKVQAGDKVAFDNSWFLALHAYHRYQVPQRAGYYPWDQFRTADGTPRYPQRALEIGPLIAAGTAGGGTHTGRINTKTILVQNLLDTGALPWNADWYRSQVRAALGKNYQDSFRLWYNDNAEHLNGPVAPADQAKIIQYDGIYYQALVDVAAWAEKGVAPPGTTNYTVSDSQIIVPKTATNRLGIQPVADLRVCGGDRAQVRVGRTVDFTATVQVPPGAGKIVRVEWDFDGDGSYAVARTGTPRSALALHASHSFAKAGTYFPAVRVTAQRDGDTTEKYTLAQNLGRARVVVSATGSGCAP
ncbi:Tat pathway signal sequence domain protein [Kribbella speibonae]|uniref:Tat pathway signal sequence domain protein n=1 Tax=Kribbella speibonae TaxID=1572660 RepID=A0A4R0IS33_9ACTN|nr:Tat pathway signal sequence domain protein [Kribbella speibonae]